MQFVSRRDAPLGCGDGRGGLEGPQRSDISEPFERFHITTPNTLTGQNSRSITSLGS